VRTSGQVLLLARDAVRSGHVQVEGLTVEAADLRGRVERPHGFGVEAMQGGFTLWNQQPDRAIQLTAELLDLQAGSPQRPVRGSGVFVDGHGDWNGAAGGGHGAVGIQVSKQLPQLEVSGDLTTAGGTGTSLVQGVQTQLSAMALSVKPGGRVGQVTVGGRSKATSLTCPTSRSPSPTAGRSSTVGRSD
jgi:hypothetical protein